MQDEPGQMTLAETQLRLRNVMVDGDPQHVASLRSLIVGGNRPEKRLVVHQRNYREGLVDSLLVQFRAPGWLLGTPCLSEAAARFIREHPPQAPCIADYGAAFPDFLAQVATADRVPYLRDFAQLEWYVGKVAIAVDQGSICSQDLSAIEPNALPDTLLTLQSGLQYVNASWPVDELMQLYLTETVTDQSELSPTNVWIEVQGARGEFRLSRLRHAEWIFRKHILEGHSIGVAAESALDVDSAFDPGQSLAALISCGLIAEIRQ